MSARPAIAQLVGEDLDLLLSRSLDGDLSPEEEGELNAFLAADPAARRRRQELAELLESMKELSGAETPFALATRVNSQVQERSTGLSAAFHRYGIYLPPGAVAAVLGIVAVAIVVASLVQKPVPRPVSNRPAATSHSAAESERVEGPVTVFFQKPAALEGKETGKQRLDWTVVLSPPESGAASWRLTSSPFVNEPTASLDGSYSLTLDEAGHVASVRPVPPAGIRPDVSALLRGLEFEPLRPGVSRQVEVRIKAR